MLSPATSSARSLSGRFIVPLIGVLGAMTANAMRGISKRGQERQLHRLLDDSSQINAIADLAFASSLVVLSVSVTLFWTYRAAKI